MFTITEFLQQEVKPALGCTEPGAVALAVAKACEQLPGTAEKLDVVVSDSIYKNGIAVGVPGTNGLRGNEIAAALAVFCGKSAYGLEVLKDASPEDLKAAKDFMAAGHLSLKANGKPGVFVQAVATRGADTGEAIIEGSHGNIVKALQNGKVTFEAAAATGAGASVPVAAQVATMNFDDVMALADQLSPADEDYVMNGVEMNLKISNYGFENQVGLGLGRAVKNAAGARYDEDLAAQVKAISAAASDARMAGVSLPVMSSAGSGNHGITAILPVYVVGKYYGKSRSEIARAIAYSHLATSFIKSRMGRLSPVCGCAVAAGAGAAAGIVNIMGGTNQQAQKAMELLLGNIIGMVCDGAKESCALKVGTGATEAFYAAQIALSGGGMAVSQGVVDISDFRKTADNAARLNREGMKDADHTLIDIISHR
ncbi:serine dehydratase subunit alpha family protein [Jonquetella anthropi]|uniref:L-cysteine desulfidase family protein n=1 Tax=Jonquetella anthropi TaxID=428712 RepID=UPI0023F2C56C|nr:L-serine ammonia-lyase, iron-sulfur-dependent, subunit alpha [Jonquetella anthropi]